MAGHSKWTSSRQRESVWDRRPGNQLRHEALPTIEPRDGREQVRFEGYGPGGAALIVDCLTDSGDHTVALVRQVLTRFGGHLGARGSVSYLFNEVGLMVFSPGTNEGGLMQVGLEAGAEDVVKNSDGSIEVLADPVEFDTVRALLREGGFVPLTAQVTQRASISVRLDGEVAVSMVQLLEALENLNDVQNVYTNVEIPDEVLARF